MKLINLKALSRETSISVYTLRKYVKQGMPSYYKGKRYMVNPGEFDDWYQDNYRIPDNDRCDDTGSDDDIDRIVEEAINDLH